MKFEHKIPKIYYSQNEDINPERMKLEIEGIKKRLPEYDISLSIVLSINASQK